MPSVDPKVLNSKSIPVKRPSSEDEQNLSGYSCTLFVSYTRANIHERWPSLEEPYCLICCLTNPMNLLPCICSAMG